MLKYLLFWLFNRLWRREVVQRDGVDYLWRWHITSDRQGAGVYLHYFLKGDNDPDPHNHPWRFSTYVIAGGYIDEVWKKNEDGTASFSHYEDCVPGKAYEREPDHIHRVMIPEGKTAWTLVFRGTRTKEWGFFTKDGLIPWRKYLGLPDSAPVR